MCDRKDSPTTVYSNDWLPERSGLETSVSREAFAEENLGEYWGNFGLKSDCMLRRVRLQFGTSSVINLEFRCHEIPDDELNSCKGSGFAGPRDQF